MIRNIFKRSDHDAADSQGPSAGANSSTAANESVAIEMSGTAAPNHQSASLAVPTGSDGATGANDPSATSAASGGGGHGREASGRSVQSVLSVLSLRDMRERDRENTLSAIERRQYERERREEQRIADVIAAETAVGRDLEVQRPDAAARAAATTQPAPSSPPMLVSRLRSILSTAIGRNSSQQQQQASIGSPGAFSNPATAVTDQAPPADTNRRNGMMSRAEQAIASANMGPLGRQAIAAAALSERRKQATKREKDEAATLFGPTLCNYFGSGSSSSGAVNGGNIPSIAGTNSVATGGVGLDPSAATAAAPAIGETPVLPTLPAMTATPASPLVGTNAAGNTVLLRRAARLGSRGRARGASLSGLSVTGGVGGMESAERLDTLSLAGENRPSSPFAQNLPMDLETPGGFKDLVNDPTNYSMADGIEIETLARWVDRTVGLSPSFAGRKETAPPTMLTTSLAGSDAIEASTHTGNPVICTTLQSYVNLKRNAIRLTPISKDDEVAANASTTAWTAKSGATPQQLAGPLSVDANPATLPPPTHTFQFEYDCAAPYASVHIFIRASRKHGSWTTAAAADGVDATTAAAEGAMGSGSDSSRTDEGGAAKYLAEKGIPPPHVLGFHVHGATLKSGFAAKARADIALCLAYFSPPSAKNKTGKGAGGAEGEVEGASKVEEEENNNNAAAVISDGEEAVPILEGGAALDTVETHQQPPAPAGPTTFGAPLSKEARAEKAAREKAARETLKMAIVVEALDEDCRPLREPNLQTSYLRVSSLPASFGGEIQPGQADSANRIWSMQVEGQEAEVIWKGSLGKLRTVADVLFLFRLDRIDSSSRNFTDSPPSLHQSRYRPRTQPRAGKSVLRRAKAARPKVILRCP